MTFEPAKQADALVAFESSKRQFAQRVPALLPHWVHLLPKPFLFALDRRQHCFNRNWLQVSDERLPTMTYLSVEDPLIVKEGDLWRLCFSDEPGERDYPYAVDFLKEDFNRLYCYDRYWDEYHKQRFMISGHNFVAIGPSINQKPGVVVDDFFELHTREHFRRHYFQMGLVCHFQNAMLLAFSNWMSETTHRYIFSDRTKFMDNIKLIQALFREFNHLHWFTGVSNHVVARETFDLWRDRVGSVELYNEVNDEAQSSYDHVDQLEQAGQVAAANQLAVAATMGVLLGLPMAFFGMNIVLPQADPSRPWVWEQLPIYAFATGALLILGLMFFFWRFRSKKSHQHLPTLPTLTPSLALLAAIFLVVGGTVDLSSQNSHVYGIYLQVKTPVLYAWNVISTCLSEAWSLLRKLSNR